MLTAAEAFTLSNSYRSIFSGEDYVKFVWCHERARRCPMIDCLDEFCDTMERWIKYTPEQRRADLQRYFEDICAASAPLRGPIC